MTVRRVVVDHVLFVVEDLDSSRRLYTAALAPRSSASNATWAPVTTAAHVAFDADDRGAVDAFFEAALANGATVRGEPGVWVQWSDRYYAAFINDQHGNNVEAVWHAPEPPVGATIRHGVP